MEGYNIGMESVSVASRARKILLKHKIKSRVVRSKSESGCSFSLYIDRFNGFNMYGKLTAVIIMLLWLYFCMYLLLVGAKINNCINNKK